MRAHSEATPSRPAPSGPDSNNLSGVRVFIKSCASPYKLFTNLLSLPYARGSSIEPLIIRLPRPRSTVRERGAGEPAPAVLRVGGHGANRARPLACARVGHFFPPEPVS